MLPDAPPVNDPVPPLSLRAFAQASGSTAAGRVLRGQTVKTCSVDGCGKNPFWFGLCSRHYRDTLDPNRVIVRRKSKPPEQRLWDHVDITPGCWWWKGGTTPEGYGKFAVTHDRAVMAYRYIYELCVGPIPDGYHLDHLCRNPNCVNWAHVEPVTPKENYLRGFGVGALNARKTHCKYGHEFSTDNTYSKPGRPSERNCRKCRADYQRKRRAEGKQ